ncbi:MAG: cation-translocating P-type ATPase [Planctomycetes bacterium]|nr:cation-translocating P-type ATPase [Planctomycetota bacterium]MBU1517944.1 cation-translocating P-type ATPase [Planctomycetota bacterium]MBU2458332.1 cation-translocating P-type ATPase [Planctomycetota bacterium]
MAHRVLHLAEHEVDISKTHQKQVRVSLALAGTLLGGTLLFNSIISPIFYGRESQIKELLAMLAAILLATPVIIHSIKGVIRGEMHMDELVALAIIAAFATGNYVAASVVAFFLLLSELVETRTALGARAAIELLIKLTPTKASLLDSSGGEKEVNVSWLKCDNIIRVRPGDNIAADGEVVKGLSSVNEATITGESLPADKVPGMQVFAGTSNLTGVLDIKVTRAGKDTTLGKVQSLILQAEHTKIPIMRIIDRYVKWYVPVILMISAIIWFFTRDVNRAIGALVVSCPCALILATPTAMVAALSASARLGILIKKVADLELAGRITAMVFDKTGTLTTGQLYVTKLTPAQGIEPAELLRFAASAEQMSKHPAARALQIVAKEANLSLNAPDDFAETPGKGVKATVEGAKVFVGRDTFLKANGIDTSVVSDPALHEEQGFSTLYIGRDKKCIGWIGMQDKTRPEARYAVEQLLETGVRRVTMLTGDRQEVARRVATELGCTDVKAKCLPHDKLAIVERMKKEGFVVAVVGDGINDAPALASGDLGIAMGAAGSDVAINSASIALMSNDLKRLPFLVKLSRKTTSIINQNLLFGILFIILGVSASAVGWLPLIYAALLHFGGSLVVVFNSARLVRYGEELEPHSYAPAANI